MKFKEPHLSIGLDIGSSTIKLVKLKSLKDKVELFDFILEPVQANLVETLKNIKVAKGIQVVNIGVCGPSTVIRYVSFPKMNALELKQALKFEAQKHIPFTMEEVNLDGYILQENLPDNKMLVLIAVAKKELINQRIKLIEDA
ncbi:MAG: pilus assembly protein PilM, partial [Candidatus Omnitrophica bacterium]|nr:pilus assembly protein PilM [Candidatus Omnitrophota bacterium]